MIDIKVLASSSRGNCYRVSDGNTPLLIEAGIPYKQIQQQVNYQLSGISGVLVTHEHMDHAKAVKDLVKAGIDCYMSEGTASAIGVTGHRIKTVTPNEKFSINTWTIMPFSTQHDAAEPLGFLLVNEAGDKLLFATDTYYIRYCFNNLNYIMVECNYSYDLLMANVEAGYIPESMKKRLLRSHFSLANVKEFLKANDLTKVQEIHLLHLSDGNSDAERFKREIQELTGKMVFVAGERSQSNENNQRTSCGTGT